MSRRSLFGGSAPLAFLGLVLGVASLVASMAVVSGFETTLRDSMSDVSGHVQVVMRPGNRNDPDEVMDRLRALEPSLVAATPFLRVEGLMVYQGKISGALLQGIDAGTRSRVLNFDSRLKAGENSLEPVDGVPAALIGKGMAARLGVKPGDRLRVVVPVSNGFDPERFSRRVGEFVVRGVLDLGKFDWNERFMVTDLGPLQDLAALGPRPHGFLLRFPDAEGARASAFRLGQALGLEYAVTDWHELNETLLEAVKLERLVIFFVVYIIVIVAAFNIASTLFVNVIRRTDEIALLKALGLKRNALLRVFSAQGVLLGVAGFAGGSLLGWLLSVGFTELQEHYQLMSGAVYKIEGIRANLRLIDLAAIALATVGICFVAALAPAWRGSRLSPVEGLRYE